MRNPDVGKRIRAVRQRLNLTQAELAKQVGVKKLSIIRYESGSASRIDVLREIARVGNVTLGWLLEGQYASRELDPVMQLREPLRRLLDNLRAELAGSSLSRMSRSQRMRYDKRAQEVLTRSRRELEEYRVLLRTVSNRLTPRARR